MEGGIGVGYEVRGRGGGVGVWWCRIMLVLGTGS